MKSTVQSKATPSTSNSSKSKKNSKEREKKKSQTSLTDSSSSNEKGSPSKDSKQYAGISSESICIYAEQSTYEHLSEEVCNTLTEDINYKLRYIIHDALLKARLSGRDAINSRDIDETFSNLSIDKVYGATSTPNWIPFGDQNLFYLDDTKVNLIELAEEENTYVQEGQICLTKNWFPDPELSEPSPALKQYFSTVCKTVLSTDDELKRMALKDVSENPQIGPIIEWFYHFGYLLLTKYISCDHVTLSALDLVETLENSPLGSANVSEKQLKLLVRLLLQRLLVSPTTLEVLKPMCSVLAILCLREPLKELVITKISQKITGGVYHETVLPVVTVIYFLGIDAIREIFLPNINYFLTRVTRDKDPELKVVTLGIYGIICKCDENSTIIHNCFQEIFGDFLMVYWKPNHFEIKDPEKEIDFINMKTQLIKTRRKVDCNIRKGQLKIALEDMFDIPIDRCKVRSRIDEHRLGFKQFKKETHLTVGKTSLLLSIFKSNKNKIFPKYCDHSLLSYNF